MALSISNTKSIGHLVIYLVGKVNIVLIFNRLNNLSVRLTFMRSLHPVCGWRLNWRVKGHFKGRIAFGYISIAGMLLYFYVP